MTSLHLELPKWIEKIKKGIIYVMRNGYTKKGEFLFVATNLILNDSLCD